MQNRGFCSRSKLERLRNRSILAICEDFKVAKMKILGKRTVWHIILKIPSHDSFPGRAVRCLPAPPQIRTSRFPAYGSSAYGFATG
ncbi:MAG TPA: hypothetical protein VKA34_16100, partial [Balneolales bacterium]|nr:hypothetical protein [Balneolales bacterium]